MNPNLAGKTFRSDNIVYALGTAFTFRLDFMAQARNMAAPEVEELDFVFTGTVGAVTGGALGRDAAKLFDTVRFRDDDEVFNMSGAGARVLEQYEVGNKQVDPGDLSSGTTNSSYIYRLRVLFQPPRRAQRGRDFRVPLAHFLEGGEITFQTPAAVPTGWNSVQSDWRVQLFARITDGRVRELKSRRRIMELAVTNQEFDYPVNGFLRNALLTSKLATTGYTTLAGFTTFFSRTLETVPSYQTHMAVDEYRRGADSLGTNDEFTLAAPGAIPIKVGDREQKTGEMIDTRTLHLDLLQAAPTSGRIIIDSVVDRSPNLAALTEGYRSPAELAAAIRDFGYVVGDSGNIPAKQMAATLVRRLPVRIKPSGDHAH
jgi:hypothetical protein